MRIAFDRADTVWLNGGNITSMFTRSASSFFLKCTLTGSILLQLGANTLRADVWSTFSNSGPQSGSASAT